MSIQDNNNAQPGTKLKSRTVYMLFVLLFFVVLSYAVILDGLPQAGSDPLGTTVVSQNIIDYHDIFMLHGKFASYFKRGKTYAYQVEKKDGQVYYYFPVGTPLLIMPLVYAENFLGVETYKNNNDAKIQKVAVMGITLFIMMMTYFIARRFYSPAWSTGISSLTFFGTLVGPTVGTGLWSIDFEILFTSIIILMLLKVCAGEYRNIFIPGLSLGMIFFFGFLVRPTFAITILASFLFLYIRNKKMLLVSAATSGILLAVFMAYCHIEIGSILPPYYSSSRLSTVNAFHAFYGLLFSPSRSIFVFTPALILLPFLYFKKNDSKWSLLINTLAIIMLTLFFINVFFPHWDAGWSYGPRILTGMSFIGALSLIIIIGGDNNKKTKYATSIVFCSLLFVGCLIDVNGMYSPYTQQWNAYPNSDIYTNYVVWNTAYPQFLMNRSMLIDKCYSQCQHLGISDTQCFPIGEPNPGSRFFPRYSHHFYAQFNALLAASSCYIKHHKISDMTPLTAENSGCLSKKYGGFRSPSPNDNWTNEGGWLGAWPPGKSFSDHVAIGINGPYSIIKGIIRKYKRRALTIYFPYPSLLDANKISENKSGQLIMVFKGATHNK